MQNVSISRRREHGPRHEVSVLSLYNEAPLVEVSLEQFEEFAIDRLHVLKAVENYRLRSVQMKEREGRLEKTLNKHMPLRSAAFRRTGQAEDDTTKDVLSHFFLRMAFCQSEELRRWFLTQESTLFRYRLDKMTREEKILFMKQNGLSYEETTMKEVEARLSKLKAVRDANDPKVRGQPLPAYFKVPFTEALDLVGSRRVYIEAGTAYVPFEHVVSILFAAFRANLSKELSGAFRKYNRSLISKDDRLAPVLSNLAKHHIDADYSSTPVLGSANAIRPDMIDGLASTSMPLCMRSLYKGLKLNHHLKFAGRQQYGLFLKGIGLQLDDAIAYWKQEFCKKMSVDDFNKKYAYNIRHNYGKEGKRKDYAPSNCMRIITGDPPKNGEYHGCPFRHLEQEHLRKALQGIPEGDKKEILSLAENHHYQIACKKYFEATHPSSDPDILINHPNGYFEESHKYYIAKEKGVVVTAKMNAASVLSSPISFVTVSNDGNFEVSSEAIEYLQQIRGPIAVVAIAGLYRTGKSYLLNLLLGRDQKKNRMFDVGATINACTKGIWIWGQPVANQKSHAIFPHLGKDTTIVFMDTEGLGSIERSQTQDTQIFALALLLSSLFIYNSRGVIDANAIEDLSLVVNLTKIIQAKAHNDKKATNCNELSRFFPDFLWVVRDFTLELKQDGKKMTSKDYFETALKQQHSFTENVVQKNKSRSLLSTFFPSRDCVTMVRPLHDEKQLRELSKQPYESLRPEFREQMEILKKKLSMSLKPKTMMSNVLNGPMLVSLTKNYVAAFNSGSSPVITSVWDRVIESQCDQALDSAKQVFREKMDAAIAEKTNLVRVNQVMRARPLEDVELVSLYETARKAADRELLREDIVSISSLKDYSLTLSEYSLEILQTKFKDNDAVSTVFNKEILQELWKPCKESLKDPSLIAEDEAQYLQNQLTASQDFLSSIVTQFNDRAAGSRKHGVLNDFLLENMVEGMFEWSTLVKTFFRSKEAQLAADIASSQHSLRSIESKVRVAQEMLTQQNDSFEKAVQSIAERIASERSTLLDDIQSKQSQIDRTRLQVEQLGTLHKEVLDRLDAQIQEAKDERNQLEAAIHSAEVCREKERQEAQRQLLQSEAKFHNEEKTLIQGQQQILKKVLELERCLGEQDVNQLAELSRVEKENTEEIFRLQLQFQELEEELRESAVQNIQVLEKEQEEERDVLQWNLDEKKKRLVILCKLLDEKEAAKTTPFYSVNIGQ